MRHRTTLLSPSVVPWFQSESKRVNEKFSTHTHLNMIYCSTVSHNCTAVAIFSCSRGTVETNDLKKKKAIYSSGTIPSQKVKHQKATEWVTLTDAVNSSGGYTAGGSQRDRGVRMGTDSWVGPMFSRAWTAETRRVSAGNVGRPLGLSGLFEEESLMRRGEEVCLHT